jgi:predicted nucleic acid-binding protein
MESPDPLLVVCDAGPVIHLDELDSLDTLRGFQNIILPGHVWSEIRRHRPLLTISDIPTAQIVAPEKPPSPRLLAIADAFALDLGEREALVLTEQYHVGLFLTDDAAARLAAESLGLEVHGTLGILVRAIRQRYRSRDQVIESLTQIPKRSTLHTAATLLEKVIARVKSAPPGPFSGN